MTKEFQVNIQMDRNPSPNATDTDLQADLDKDNYLMKEFRHGLGCGCGTCISYALQQRRKIRGTELPTDAAGQLMNPFKKGR